jgi:hypothetical protein
MNEGGNKQAKRVYETGYRTLIIESNGVMQWVM